MAEKLDFNDTMRAMTRIIPAVRTRLMPASPKYINSLFGRVPGGQVLLQAQEVVVLVTGEVTPESAARALVAHLIAGEMGRILTVCDDHMECVLGVLPDFTVEGQYVTAHLAVEHDHKQRGQHG